MGTNYFLHQNVCEHCGRGDPEPLHIGKSSGGWCFSLHVQDPKETWGADMPTCLEAWQRLWNAPKAIIKSEYDEVISPSAMLDGIQDRGWGDDLKWQTPPPYYDSWDDFHRRNHSVAGPNGLLRHRIDGRHCIGHSVGTWDLVIGDFS